MTLPTAILFDMDGLMLKTRVGTKKRGKVRLGSWVRVRCDLALKVLPSLCEVLDWLQRPPAGELAFARQSTPG